MIETPIDTVAATIKNGNAAIAVFRAYPGARKITVEEPVSQQFYVDSYGGSTLSLRQAASAEHNRTVCAELVDMWRMAKVIRLGAENFSQAGSATERALNLIEKRVPEIETLLFMEGEDE